jgi:hypothetical protein
MARSWVLGCVLAFVLSGCAGLRTVEGSATQSGWPPLAPATLGAERIANQVLRVAYGERESTLNCAIVVDAKKLTIVGTTALGMRAFTVRYDGANIEASAQPGVPDTLPPERLLNDVQLVYWPLTALQRAMQPTGFSVSEPAPGTRRLRRGDKLIAEVHYASGDAWQGRAWLVNLEFGYALQIESQLSSASQ